MDGVPGTPEGRRIREVQITDLVDGQTRPESDRQGADPLNGPFFANTLAAKQLSRCLVADQLHTEFLPFGHGTADGKPPDHGAHRLESIPQGFLLRQARGSHLQVEDLEGLGAHDAGKFRRIPAGVLAGNAPLLVGNVTEGEIDPLPGYFVEGFAAVTHGIDPLAGCLLPEVHLDGPAFPHDKSHRFGQRRVSPGADAHQDQIGIQLAMVRDQFQPVALPLFDGHGFRFREKLNLVLAQLFHDHLGEFGIPPDRRPGEDVHDLDFDPQVSQGLAHLHPDIARPDQDGLFAAPLVEIGFHLQGVGQVPDDIDPFQVFSRDVQADRIGPCGHDQKIIGGRGSI